MKQYVAADFAFAGTSVDREEVIQYLFNTNLSKARFTILHQAHPLIIDSITHTEFVELEIRHYVGGYRKNLRQVNQEVRDFMRFAPLLAPPMIRLSIIRLRHHFIKNEWYELMPRLEKAATKIETLLT